MSQCALALDRVSTYLPAEDSRIDRDWGANHNSALKGDGMEMHFTRVPVGTVCTPHIHTCGTMYYVLKGSLYSISGAQLQHIELQKTGSFVFVPKNVLHTVANFGDEEVITIVSHDAVDVEKLTDLLPDYSSLLERSLKSIDIPNAKSFTIHQATARESAAT